MLLLRQQKTQRRQVFRFAPHNWMEKEEIAGQKVLLSTKKKPGDWETMYKGEGMYSRKRCWIWTKQRECGKWDSMRTQRKDSNASLCWWWCEVWNLGEKCIIAFTMGGQFASTPQMYFWEMWEKYNLQSQDGNKKIAMWITNTTDTLDHGLLHCIINEYVYSKPMEFNLDLCS